MTNKAKEEKRILRNIARSDPEVFNKLDYADKFLAFTVVFDEYVKNVAIPKEWEFTKTLKHWPDGTGQGEGITEDGRVWYNEEKAKLLQQVLNYPDLALFAMEKYSLLIDSYLIPNKKDKTGPPAMGLHIEKTSKSKALEVCNLVRKEFQQYKNNKPQTEKWDEKELSEDKAFDAIDNFHKLGREERIRLQAYIVYKYAENVGIPLPPHNDDAALTTDIQKAIRDNAWTIDQVWKRQKDFFYFSLAHYGMLPIFGKNKNNEPSMDLKKVPDKTLHKIVEIMKSEREFTVEEMDANMERNTSRRGSR